MPGRVSACFNRSFDVLHYEVTAATDAAILKKKIFILYGYSRARVQRTTIASSTIGDVNNYNVIRTTIGGVNNYSVVYSGTGGVSNQPVAFSGTGGVNS